jgi:hypothetical protein
MLALAHLIGKGPDWKGSRININMVVLKEEERAGLDKHMKQFIQNSRLNASFRLIPNDGQSPLEVVRRSSRDARMVLLGLRQPGQDEDSEAYSRYYEQLLADTAGLPLTAMVLASETVDFQNIFL